MRDVDVRHPREHDILGQSFTIAGLGTACEGTVAWHLEDVNGHRLQEGFVQGGSMGLFREFVGEVTLDAGITEPAGATLLVYGDTPALPDEGESPGFSTTRIPVVLVPGAQGFIVYEVQPGDTLSEIAWNNGDGQSSVQAIVVANRDRVQDPDHIEVGWQLRVSIK